MPWNLNLDLRLQFMPSAQVDIHVNLPNPFVISIELQVKFVAILKLLIYCRYHPQNENNPATQT